MTITLILLSFIDIFCLKITDKNNNPIGFTSIKNTDSSYGIIADEDGNLCLDSKNLTDSVLIHSLGYKTLKIKTSELVNKNTITLEEDIVLLDEVIIKNKAFKTLEAGHFTKKPLIVKHQFSPNSNIILTSFIKNKLDKKVKTTKLKFRFAPRKTNIIDRFVMRVRIFEDFNHKPAKDLLNKNMIFEVLPNDKFFELNVENEGLTLPVKGFWLGLEVVGYYDKSNKFIHVQTGQVDKFTSNNKGKKIQVSNISPNYELIETKQKDGFKFNLNKWLIIDSDEKNNYRIPIFGVEVID